MTMDNHELRAQCLQAAVALIGHQPEAFKTDRAATIPDDQTLTLAQRFYDWVKGSPPPDLRGKLPPLPARLATGVVPSEPWPHGESAFPGSNQIDLQDGDLTLLVERHRVCIVWKPKEARFGRAYVADASLAGNGELWFGTKEDWATAIDS